MLKAVVAGGYTSGVRIAEVLGAELVGVHEKVFPDGEQYVRLLEPEKVQGSTTLVITSMYPGQDQSLTRLLILADALVRNNALMIIGVIPYMAYSRQDKVFMQGEPVSALAVLNALKSARYSRVFTVDFHSKAVLSEAGSYIVNIMVSDILVKAVAGSLVKPVIIAPDKGALERARIAAESIGAEYDYLVKSRDRVTGEVSYSPSEINVAGKDVVIVDDIISTGGTIAEASRILLKNSARAVYVAASHGLMAGSALQRIIEAGVKRVVLGNTLSIVHAHPIIEYVDIAGRVASVVKDSLGI